MLGRQAKIFRPGHAYRVTHDFVSGKYQFVKDELVRHLPNPGHEGRRRYCLIAVGPAKYWTIPAGEVLSYRKAFNNWRDMVFAYEFENAVGAAVTWELPNLLPPEGWLPFFEDLSPEIAAPVCEAAPVDHTPKLVRRRWTLPERLPAWLFRGLIAVTVLGLAPPAAGILAAHLPPLLPGCDGVHPGCMIFGQPADAMMRELQGFAGFNGFARSFLTVAICGWVCFALHRVWKGLFRSG